MKSERSKGQVGDAGCIKGWRSCKVIGLGGESAEESLEACDKRGKSWKNIKKLREGRRVTFIRSRIGETVR